MPFLAEVLACFLSAGRGEESHAGHISTILDTGLYNLLSMKNFQGVCAGNMRRCLLNWHIGKVR